VQDQPPEPARQLDDARIGQELGEVAPDRALGRSCGGAEVDQYDAGGRRAAVFVVGLAEVLRHGWDSAMGGLSAPKLLARLRPAIADHRGADDYP